MGLSAINYWQQQLFNSLKQRRRTSECYSVFQVQTYFKNQYFRRYSSYCIDERFILKYI